MLSILFMHLCVCVCVCVCVCAHTQWCLTFCNPMDCSLSGSFVHGISQARILEQVAISYSRDLPEPGIEPMFLASPALAGRFFTTAPPGKPLSIYTSLIFYLFDLIIIERSMLQVSFMMVGLSVSP